MAENESLDLNSGRASRWIAVLTAVRKGDPCQKVGSEIMKTLSRAIRNSMRQFEEYGLAISDFVAHRGSPEILSGFIRQTKGHPYAKLLVSVLNTSSSLPSGECIHQWLWAVLNTMVDQIGQRVAGRDPYPSFHDVRSYFHGVEQEIEADVEMMAARLCDPQWKPSVRGTKGEPKVDATAELLSMSLVGGTRP